MARLRCLAVLLALLMLLTLVHRSRAYPGYYTIPDEDSAAKRDVLSMETKSDRFFLGPRFGKRHQERAPDGDKTVSGAAEDLSVVLSDGLTFSCVAIESGNVYRCHRVRQPVSERYVESGGGGGGVAV